MRRFFLLLTILLAACSSAPTGPSPTATLDPLLRPPSFTSPSVPPFPSEARAELLTESAPRAVNSFIFLARAGWYDGCAFFKVVPGYLALTGDPSDTGLGGPGYYFTNEIDPALHFDGPGWLGMFNSGGDTNGSQFFVTLGAQPNLDGVYTLFGRVTSGLKLFQSLTPRDPDALPPPPPGDPLLSVTIEVRP